MQAVRCRPPWKDASPVLRGSQGSRASVSSTPHPRRRLSAVWPGVAAPALVIMLVGMRPCAGPWDLERPVTEPLTSVVISRSMMGSHQR